MKKHIAYKSVLLIFILFVISIFVRLLNILDRPLANHNEDDTSHVLVTLKSFEEHSIVMIKKRQYSLIAASILAILTPLSYIFYWILRVDELPTDDYWGIISHFYSVNGFSTNPSNWLVRSNEHFILIPSFIYAINILVTNGTNQGLSLVAVSFAFIQSLLLIVLLPPSLKRSQVVFLLLLLGISIFTFTPAAAHNWMRGFSGVAWIGANMFVTISIFCLIKLVNEKQIGWAVGSIIFAGMGCLTYSTALAVWPVLCAAVVLMRLRLRLILLYVSFAVLIGSVFLLNYRTPSHHPSLSNLSISDALIYIPIYIGAVFASEVNFALSIGTIGLIAATSLVGYWLLLQPHHPIKTAWLPWLALQAYVVVTAFMAAITRSEFGIEQARESRYASLPSLFWLSLAVIVVLWLQQLHFNPRRYWLSLMPLIAVITMLILSMYNIGATTAQAIANRAAIFHPLVALSVQLGASDTALIGQITFTPEEFLRLTDALKAHGIVPFNRDIKQDNFCTALDQKIDSNLLNSQPQDNIPGFFDQIAMLTSQVAKVQGWAGNSQSNIKCIAILNQGNLVRGFAVPGFPRPDVVQALLSNNELSGWQGYVQILPEDRQLTAYAVFNDRKDWIALPNSHEL